MSITKQDHVRTVIKENIVYFITMMICIALFYGFVSLGDIKNPLVKGNKEHDFEIYAPMIRYCIYAASISVFILISYVNAHMFREKLKEISILITLGMQRSRIAIWYSRDMLFISTLSFSAGMICGIACSYAVHAVISMAAYGKIISNQFFYINSFLETVIFFLIMYGGMTAVNIFKVMNKKPLELLNNSKVPDSKKVSALQKMIEFLFMVGSYCFIAYHVKTYFSIGRDYGGKIPKYESNKFQFIIFAAIIIAIYFTIKMINYLLIYMKNSKFVKYGMAALVIGKVSHRMKSITRNMLLITIVLTLSLCGFSLIPLMAEFSNEYMEHRMVFDINVPFNYDNIENMDDIPHIDYQFVRDILTKAAVEIENECELEQYFIWDTDFAGPSERANKYDMPRLAMGITDYNQLRIMADLEPVHLDSDGFIFHVKDDIDIMPFLEAMGEEAHSINVAGALLSENTGCFLIIDNLGDYIYNTNTDSFLVLPDRICEKLSIAKKGYFVNTVKKTPYAVCKNADQEIKRVFETEYEYLYDKYGDSGNQEIDFIGPIRFRTMEENDISFMMIITKALGMYIGIIFMLICMAMVSIKNINEFNSSIRDYHVLRQFGMSGKQLKRLNLKENLFFYLLPYIVSIINFHIIRYTFILRFGDRADTYFRGNQYQSGMMAPVIIISIILLIYVSLVQMINYSKIKKMSDHVLEQGEICESII